MVRKNMRVPPRAEAGEFRRLTNEEKMDGRLRKILGQTAAKAPIHDVSSGIKAPERDVEFKEPVQPSTAPVYQKLAR